MSPAAEGPARDAVAPPKQARSRRSYHRMLEATAELLAERPFDDITVDEIVERAGYTKGAFYARFDSKQALLRHLVARLTDGALEAWETFLDPDRWAEVPLADILEAFVRRMVAIYTRSGNLMRAVDREVQLGGDDAVRAIMERLNGQVADGFLRLVASRREETAEAVRHDLEGACRYWLAAVVAVLRAGFLRPTEGLGRVAPDQVEARTIRLLVPYLAAP